MAMITAKIIVDEAGTSSLDGATVWVGIAQGGVSVTFW
jgi:hypothetical protein